MNRRRLLGTLGSGALAVSTAGCLSGVLGGCSNRTVYDLELVPVDPVEYAGEHSRPTPDDGAERVLRAGTRAGAPYVLWNSEPTLDEGVVYELDGAYYRVEIEELRPRTEVTAHEYRVRAGEAVRADATPGSTVAVVDLPPADRATVLASPVGRRLDPDRRAATFSGTVTFTYPEGDARERSAFVPTPQYRYLRYGETVLAVTPAGTHRRPLLQRRVDVSRVAPSAAAYGRRLLSETEVGVDPDALSREARAYVENASDGGVVTRVCPGEDPPPHVPEVLSALSLANDPDREVSVAYDGRWYLVDLDLYQEE